jgi:hypothetical protein
VDLLQTPDWSYRDASLWHHHQQQQQQQQQQLQPCLAVPLVTR